MSLIGPILDDRSYEQLRRELIQRIPVYAPEWTDHNESDPGIALLDLFAFLGESLLYRFNQIPDATKVAFLRLLDVQPRPAQPARALVVAETERPDGVQILVGQELRAGAVSFETDNEVYVWPLDALGAGKIPAGEPQGSEEAKKAEEARRRDAVRRMRDVDPAQARLYTTAVLPADPIDVAATVDQALWVALLRRDTTNVDAFKDRTVFVGVAFDETIGADLPAERYRSTGAVAGIPADRRRSTGLGEDPPAVLWRLWTGTTLATLEVVSDTTRGLTETGVVGITLPGPPYGTVSDGGLDRPPLVDDPKLAGRVVAWLQVTRPVGENDLIHTVRWVGANAVQATQTKVATAELLGLGDGQPGQAYRLTRQNVVPGTVRLEVEEAGVWTPWQQVEDFLRSRDEDRHYVLESLAGGIRFGPGGRQGRIPQIGERIRVTAYRHGGGTGGNVPAGAITAVTGVVGIKITNPFPAEGGRDAEPLQDALDRIPGEVHRRDRAVTEADFEDLAGEVAGVKRAEALALFHPDTPLRPAAGVISVVVFPGEDGRNPGAPMPDLALLRRVARHLDQRRLITTELYVIPPVYRQVSVAAGVVVRRGYQVDAVRRWVELILRQFLAPLPPFGPEGNGWPLGRVIRRAELEAIAVQVDGVEYLQGLKLAEQGQEAPEIRLRRREVPELVHITVVEGEPLAPGDTYRPTTPPGTRPVPLPREVC